MRHFSVPEPYFLSLAARLVTTEPATARLQLAQPDRPYRMVLALDED